MKKRKLLSAILALVMILTMMPAGMIANAGQTNDGAAGPLPFEDVKAGAWYYDSVQYVYENGLMTGTSGTEFSPDGNLTRAMFVTILGRMAGVDQNEYNGSSFSDVNTGIWYSAYIEWAAQNNVTNGIGDGKFGIDVNISREQMATLIARYVSSENISLPDDPDPVKSFKDIDKVDSWARDGLELMRKSGIIKGDENGNFKPLDPATRAQAAAIFERLDKAVESQTAEFTVKFESNGGNGIADQKVKNGSRAAVPEEPEKEGSIFAGWCSDQELTEYYDFDTPVRSDLTLYAKWKNASKITDLYTDTADVPAGRKTDVVFYACTEGISDTELELVEDDVRVIAVLKDDGKSADEKAGDGIYSASVELYSDEKTDLIYSVYSEESGYAETAVMFYLELTDEQLYAGDEILDQMCEIASKYTESDDADADLAAAEESYKAVTAYLDKMKLNGNVTGYEIMNDGIHFRTYGDLEYVFMYEALLKSDTAENASYERNNSINKKSVNSSFGSVSTSDYGLDVCVLKPYNWQHPGSQFNDAAGCIRDSGLSTGSKVFEDQDVTVDRMKKLSGYEVILIESHGGKNSICTGEVVTSESKRRYKADIEGTDNRGPRIEIVQVSNDETGRSYYSVTDEFFKRYYKDSEFHNSLFYIGSCHGADDPSLGNTLRKKGAAAVLAFSNSVSTDYAGKMCGSLIRSMCLKDSAGDYRTLSYSLSFAKAANGDYDANNWLDRLIKKKVAHSDPSELKLNGRGDLRLSDYNRNTEESGAGSIITFGHYKQDIDYYFEPVVKPIEWIVLKKEGNKALLLSKFALDCQPYNEEDESVTWENCTLRKWLNETFINEAFSSSEQSQIQLTKVSNPDSYWGWDKTTGEWDGNNTGTGSFDQSFSTYHVEGGNDTKDKVFLLSLNEAKSLLGYNSQTLIDSDGDTYTGYPNMQAACTDYAESYTGALKSELYKTPSGEGCCRWWLRSPGYYSSYVSYVLTGGSVDGNYVGYRGPAVRPALWVDLAS